MDSRTRRKNTDRYIRFLKELKASHADMGKIFTEGSCYRLCVIFACAFQTDGVFIEYLYSETDGHWIVELRYDSDPDCQYFDINGELATSYVKGNGYEKAGTIRHQSAYVPTHGGQCCSYGKYKRTQ